jgi:hypothetical protein
MFATSTHRRDFADTAIIGMESALTYLQATRLDAGDAADPFVQAERADRQLLGMVACVACATFVLALVTSLA